MEKRSLVRNHIRISVACRCLTFNSPAPVSNGIMLNCSFDGACIELDQRIQQGSILMIKATGGVENKILRVPPEGFRTLSLAEVKWIVAKGGPRAYNYMIGLKYLASR
jgi:hypothetical protein